MVRQRLYLLCRCSKEALGELAIVTVGQAMTRGSRESIKSEVQVCFFDPEASIAVVLGAAGVAPRDRLSSLCRLCRCNPNLKVTFFPMPPSSQAIGPDESAAWNPTMVRSGSLRRGSRKGRERAYSLPSTRLGPFFQAAKTAGGSVGEAVAATSNNSTGLESRGPFLEKRIELSFDHVERLAWLPQRRSKLRTANQTRRG